MTTHNPWVGASFGKNSLELAKRLSAAYDSGLTDGPDEHGADTELVRSEVRSSWRRALDSGIDPDRGDPPVDQSASDTVDRWAAHPLAPFAAVVEQMLGSFAYDAGHIVVIADTDGCLLWSAGHPRVLRASESIAFTPGRVWTERAVGTNGVGTALAVDHPIQIFASEHFRRSAHSWVCAGAPVHDPATGRTLGVIDVSSGIRAAHPYSLALVSAAATMVETLLAGQHAVRVERLRTHFYERVARRHTGACALIDARGGLLASHPEGWLQAPLLQIDGHVWVSAGEPTIVLEAEPFGNGASVLTPVHDSAASLPVLRLSGAGDGLLRVTRDGVELRLSPRRSQLLALLASTPAGLHAPELAAALYGSRAHTVAVRAEVSRLRAQLGGLIAANPYRLIAEVDSDSAALEAALSGVATPLQP